MVLSLLDSVYHDIYRDKHFSNIDLSEDEPAAMNFAQLHWRIVNKKKLRETRKRVYHDIYRDKP